MPSYQSLLKPEVLDTVKGLELVARIVVEGFLVGGNRSQRVGIGQEFSQYRAYEPGDDLRLLDWKMYGRSERYYIRQAEVDTNITVKFVLDTSASMDHQQGKLTKLQYAQVLIASLAYLAQQQGDQFGLFGVNEQGVMALHPRLDKQHFSRFLYQLLQLEATGQWPRQGKPESQFRRGGEKELIIFLSDLYDHQEELAQFLKRLKTARNEVLLFHLVAPNEETLDYSGVVTLEDMETGKRVQVDAKEARTAYTQHWEQFVAKHKQTALDLGVDYHRFRMGDPVEQALKDFLHRRKFVL
ncbi:MAG: DUF58 domain-containing protein [Bacteroidota bacterium]